MSLSLRAARALGMSGVLLSLLFVAGVWAGGMLAYAPVQATLNTAQTQLVALDGQLGKLEQAVTPLDELVRPEAQGAVRTLAELARSAESTPLLGTVFGAENLQQATRLTQRWEAALAGRLPLAQTLSSTRSQVSAWQAQVSALNQWLRLGALTAGGVLTFLALWFGLGQWALYRLAAQELRARAGAE